MFETSLDHEVAYSIQRAEDKLPNLNGLKMRDLFAMSALNGMLANTIKMDVESLVNTSYQIADAMIERRNK